VIEVSDTHINSTVALCPPRVALDDGGEYRASREQRILWDWWLDFHEWAKDLTKGYRRVTVLGGDAGELDTKRRSYQIISPNKATIQSMVIDTLTPCLDWTDALVVIRGTPAHVGKSAWLESWLADDLDELTGGKAYQQYRAVAAGVPFDIAHHASMGRLPWTEKQAANKIAAEAVADYNENDDSPPKVLTRSHNHRWSIDRDNYPIHVYCLPAWSFATEFVGRMGKYNKIADIGGGVWLCEDGKYTWHKRDYRLTKGQRRVWAIKM